jgi:AAA15 family ATPase/GTPase
LQLDIKITFWINLCEYRALRRENMLKNLKLTNYRCFFDHTVDFKDKNIIVGENNAGKSTIIEALRLISIIVARYKSLTYYPVPDWLNLPSRYKGVRPSLGDYDFNFESVFHRYGEPPSKLIATFSNGNKITVHINNDNDIFAVLEDKDDRVITNKGQAKNIYIPDIRILPAITQLRLKEKKILDDRVQKAHFSNLSSLHFRNQLLLYPDKYEIFGELVQETWEGCQIESLEMNDDPVTPIISLLVRDDDFVAEVAWMGHGLQMWIQIMWFLSFASREDVVILDEPDVYMHADLQRKIVKILNNRHFLQTMIATHSLEIISEAHPENILIIDKAKISSEFANSTPSVQKLIDDIGCLHNIQLTRFWKCKKCLLVEGEDINILKHLHSTLFPYSENPLEIVPNMPIGGWSGLKYAVGTSLMLKNSAGETVNTYLILDRDYYTGDEIEDVYNEAQKKGLKLHIWSRKEIENYLIIPEVICRIIEKRANKDVEVSVGAVQTAVEEICDSLHDDTFDNLSNEFWKYSRSERETANRKARALIKAHWGSLDGKLKLVSGKDIISKLSKWSQDTYNVSFSAATIVREIRKDEIDSEMKHVLESIEKNVSF